MKRNCKNHIIHGWFGACYDHAPLTEVMVKFSCQKWWSSFRTASWWHCWSLSTQSTMLPFLPQDDKTKWSFLLLVHSMKAFRVFVQRSLRRQRQIGHPDKATMQHNSLLVYGHASYSMLPAHIVWLVQSGEHMHCPRNLSLTITKFCSRSL